jgi:predicted lipoprotein with Yx(FWY)xxD motif
MPLMRIVVFFAVAASIAVMPAFAAPPHAKVLVRSTAVGKVLVDARGRTLYTRSIDVSRKSTCYGSCAAAWPPFLTSAKPLAGSGAKQSLLGTTRRTNGTLQVTYAGHPLYYNRQDAQPGEISAQGTASNWWLIGSSGKKITKLPGGGYIGTTT